jgi:filamentous hemagglutinin family protein
VQQAPPRRTAGRRRRPARALPAALAAALLAVPVQAEVVLDGSMDLPPGAERSVPMVGNTWEITDDLGRYSGANLFHSFSSFDVGAGEIASFQPAPTSAFEPANVIARVTGGLESQIEGRVHSQHPGADLYLLNPNGFFFGPQSAIQALGRVYVSSADVLRFEDGGEFDARSAEPPSVLSAAAPSAFGFLTDDPGGITVAGAFQFTSTMPVGGTLGLVGGPVKVQASRIQLRGGGIELASVRSVGPLGTDVPVDVASFDVGARSPGELGTIELSGGASLDVGTRPADSMGTGRVVIRGGRFVMDRAFLQAGAANAVAGEEVAVDVEVAGVLPAPGDPAKPGVEIKAGSLLAAFTSSAADAGDVRLVGPEVVVSGAGTRLILNAAAAGAAPDLEVVADEFRLDGGASLLSRTTQVDPDAVGGAVRIRAQTGATVSGGALLQSLTTNAATGGPIAFEGGPVRVADDSRVVSETQAGGSGGGIEIGRVGAPVAALTVDTGGEVSSINAGSSSGDAGGLGVVVSGEVRVQTLGRIVAEAAGSASGRGGNVQVSAGERILVESVDADTEEVSQISAVTSSSDSRGAGGDLTVRAPLLELLDGGALRTSSAGAAPAGDLLVTGTDAFQVERVHVSGTALLPGEEGEPPRPAEAGLFARAAGTATGDGGELRIQARVVEVENGGTVSTRSLGDGDAGLLVIENAEQVTVRGGVDASGTERVSSLTARGAQGAGGDLEIHTDTLLLENGGVVSASTLGDGDAGALSVFARQVTVTGTLGNNPDGANPSGLFSQTTFGDLGSGDGGDLTLDVSESLEVSHGARVSVAAPRGGGLPGDITIRNAERVTLTDGGAISARVVGDTRPSAGPEDAADIVLENIGRLEMSGSTISAETTGTGLGGRIEVQARESVELRSGSLVTARSSFPSLSNAGTISIDGGRSLLVVKSAIETRADVASGGRVRLQASEIVYLSDSIVDTLVQEGNEAGLDEPGNGGDFNLPVPEDPAPPLLLAAAAPLVTPGDPPGFVVLNRSGIIATAIDGNGGNITIAAQNFLASDESVIDASSETGLPGEVEIKAPDAELAGQITPLPTSFFDASKLMRTPCAARTARAGSFVVQTRAAIPPPPDGPLSPAIALDAAEADAPGTGNCPI